MQTFDIATQHRMMNMILPRLTPVVVVLAALLLLDSHVAVVLGQELDRTLDRFNYDTTKTYSDRIDFGPAEWIKVRCDGKDKTKCVRFRLLGPHPKRRTKLIPFSVSFYHTDWLAGHLGVCQWVGN
jgi:hypothetical protein